MLKLTFKTDNAAFADYPGAESARILREMADKIDGRGFVSAPVRDVNGNTVGRIDFDADGEA
jgi:hypothetical protein